MKEMSPRKIRGLLAKISLVLLAALACPSARAADAAQILQAAGAKGGLIIHLGCGDAKLTAALRASDSFLVHGLDADAKNVDAARKHLQSLGLYGKITIDQFAGDHLPFVDNLASLLVVSGQTALPDTELLRVLAPNGAAVRLGANAEILAPVLRKPWPKEIDEWTHAFHGPDNNEVAHDTVVGPPKHLQWVTGPKWTRSHDHLASVSVAVSSGGRMFYIVDEGPTAAVALPSKWFLVACDAFSGVELWRKPIAEWEGRFRGFRTGPAALSRRLVAVGDTVYVTLGYNQPVTALDAATGQLRRTYAGTDSALEIVCDDGNLFVVVGDALAHAQNGATQTGTVIAASKDRLLAFKADTGALLWQRYGPDTDQLMPTTLAVSGGRVYFQNPREIICAGARSGEDIWRAARPVTVNRWAWSAPTLVVQNDVVISADRNAQANAVSTPLLPGQSAWTVSSKGGDSENGQVLAFSASAGKKLWESVCRESYNAAVDVFVTGGKAWWGDLCKASESGITQGRDVMSGQVTQTLEKELAYYAAGMGHHRCYRNKATDRYLLLGRAGVEYIDLKTGKALPNHWIRGVCQYGIVPCNGLLYIPPHSCACYIEAKLNGFNALASAEQRAQISPPAAPLTQGPAFAAAANLKSNTPNPNDWPTYRHDAARSGRTPMEISPALAPSWQTEVGAKLSSPVVAEGKLFVADIDVHTVHALDAASGQRLWSFTAGGRVDSSPTIYQGLALFGSADGYVYCLRAADGQLVWKFRAATDDQRLVSYGQVESVWPVPGNVLIQDGAAFFASGRSSYLDGGMTFYRLEPSTGKVLTRQAINSRDAADAESQATIKGVSMPGALPDVLASDGTSVFLRQMRFNFQGLEQPNDVPHLFSPAGFLDDAWWHRTYWILGTKMNTGWGGWLSAGLSMPSGRLLVQDDTTVYSYGLLNQYATHGTHVELAPELLPWPMPPAGKAYEKSEYRLFACSKTPKTFGPPPGQGQKGNKKKAQQKAVVVGESANETKRGIETQWAKPVPVWTRAMVLAGKTLFIAGPPDVFSGKEGDADILAGKKGGLLWATATADGKQLAEYKLASPPVFDGLIAANQCLYLATLDGKIVCYRGH